MGRKNIVYNFKSLKSADMSTAQLLGVLSNVAQFDTVTYEFSWSGGAATNGNIAIEYTRDEFEPKIWKELDFGAVIDTNGASGTHRLIITEIGFLATRPKYDRVNGAATGSMNVSVFATNKGA